MWIAWSGSVIRPRSKQHKHYIVVYFKWTTCFIIVIVNKTKQWVDNMMEEINMMEKIDMRMRSVSTIPTSRRRSIEVEIDGK